jgi:choline dehydrogenase-like flavoprotein
MQTDYVIVGTGSAGSVVANRLSADPRVNVVVLEAGPMDTDKFVHIPAAFSKLFRSPMDWDYLTEPQKEVGGREIYWPRGKVLGGSSSMNAMMWVPGFPADYDEWAEHAGEEWDYAHLRTYFDRVENGALVISPQRSPRASTSAWLRAAEQVGYRITTPDAPMTDGFCETAVNQRRGARWTGTGTLDITDRKTYLFMYIDMHVYVDMQTIWIAFSSSGRPGGSIWPRPPGSRT